MCMRIFSCCCRSDALFIPCLTYNKLHANQLRPLLFLELQIMLSISLHAINFAIPALIDCDSLKHFESSFSIGLWAGDL